MKHQPRVEHRSGPTQTAQAGNENIGAGHTLAHGSHGSETSKNLTE